MSFSLSEEMIALIGFFILGCVWFVTFIVFIALWIKKRAVKQVLGTDSEQYKRVSKTKRVVGVVCVLALLGGGLTVPDQENAPSSQPQETTQQKQIEGRQKDDIFCKTYGMSLKQAQVIENALDSVGLGEIKDVTKDGNTISLKVKAKNEKYTPADDEVKLLLDDANNLKSIKLDELTMYSDGQVFRSVDNIIISMDEENEAEAKSEKIVKQVLKAPSTADFDTDTFRYQKTDDGGLLVIGTVDSQNSFGAMIRSTFKIQYSNFAGAEHP